MCQVPARSGGNAKAGANGIPDPNGRIGFALHLTCARTLHSMSHTQKLTIGYASNGYPERRNFLGLPHQAISFKRVRDVTWLPKRIAYQVGVHVSHRMHNTFIDCGLNGVDGYHFFNAITPSRKPWFVTYETSVPRLAPDWKRGYEWLAAESCKGIIAISQRAWHLQMRNLERFPRYRDAIAQKLHLIHPPQQRIVDQPRDPHAGPLIVTFVGGFFYHKGGLALLEAFRRLKAGGAKLRLNIVSKMQLCGWRDEFATPAIRAATLDAIAATPDVTFHQQLTGEKVIDLLKESDVGVLPSYGETYGYSILEAMACGCAVVVPRVSPFMEFVTEECGVLLPVPTILVDGLETMDFTVGQQELHRHLVKSLVDALAALENDRESLKAKGGAALRRISASHCPHNAANLLGKLYGQACGSR